MVSSQLSEVGIGAAALREAPLLAAAINGDAALACEYVFLD